MTNMNGTIEIKFEAQAADLNDPMSNDYVGVIDVSLNGEVIQLGYQDEHALERVIYALLNKPRYE